MYVGMYVYICMHLFLYDIYFIHILYLSIQSKDLFCHYVGHLLFHLLLAKTQYGFDNKVQHFQLNNICCHIKVPHKIQL